VILLLRRHSFHLPLAPLLLHWSVFRRQHLSRRPLRIGQPPSASVSRRCSMPFQRPPWRLPPMGCSTSSLRLASRAPPNSAAWTPPRLAAAKAKFQAMLDEGIIRRSCSQWSSPLHMVRKKDGSWRPCGDYRHLNLQTVEDRYPLLNMADLAARLAGCTIFSKLDLRKGYL
jgi:hypothetical protein